MDTPARAIRPDATSAFLHPGLGAGSASTPISALTERLWQPIPFAAPSRAPRAAGAGRPNVAFIESAALIHDIAEVNRDIYLHFERAVYLRLYEAIGACHQAWLARRAAERVRTAAPAMARPDNSLFSRVARLLAERA